MKKITTIIILLSLSISSFSQADTSHPKTSADYRYQSRSQRISGLVLLGISATCLAIGAPGNVSFETLGALVFVGGASALGSIPLLIAAGRNKRKAKRMSAGINLQKSLLIQANSFAFHYYPAVKLTFRL
jgi:hypothetical protein